MTKNVPPSYPDVAEVEKNPAKTSNAVEYDTDTGAYRVSFDRDTDPVCMAVVSTVAAVSETDPTELPPLASVVAPDALATLIGSPEFGPAEGDITVSFLFAGFQVAVHSYGIITVQPQETASNASGTELKTTDSHTRQ